LAETQVALVVGGGPGISASCARLFSQQGMKVAVAARNVNKAALQTLAEAHGATLVACDASDPASVAAMFEEVSSKLGTPRLVGQQAAIGMLDLAESDGHRGTILFTNASAALKGYPRSGAFAAASHGKAGLAQSMARELMPQGIHVAHVPIDAAIGWEQPDGSRTHRLAGEAVEDNMAHPDHIADVYLQLHRQHKSTWAFEVVLRPWKEKW